jgi:ATP-dependent exoDNAse (exonuclease V) alpha subunit
VFMSHTAAKFFGLNALDPVTLVLVSDVDQLNRVGQGQVFRDPLESGEVPVIRILQCRKDKKMEETGTLETIKALLLN